VSINGVTLHYQQLGMGQDLVMIHGLFANLAFWYLSVAPALAPRFRITLYDLRGHGLSEMPRSGYTSSAMASDLAGLLDYLKVKQAHVVGHSCGGAVALQYSQLYPEKTLSLTLADAWVPSLQPALPLRAFKRSNRRMQQGETDVPPNLPRVAHKFLQELAEVRQHGRCASEQGSLTGGALLVSVDSSSLLVKRWSKLMNYTSVAQELNATAGLTVDRLRKITQPTLAIFGQRSTCQTTLRGLEGTLPNLIKVIVPGAGHFHPIVKPHFFVSQLGNFVLGSTR